jgi:hypothetical protein
VVLCTCAEIGVFDERSNEAVLIDEGIHRQPVMVMTRQVVPMTTQRAERMSAPPLAKRHRKSPTSDTPLTTTAVLA